MAMQFDADTTATSSSKTRDDRLCSMAGALDMRQKIRCLWYQDMKPLLLCKNAVSL